MSDRNIVYFDDVEMIQQELVRSGFEEYIESHALQRLKGISYLATMDNIYNKDRRYSRFEHSLSVAYVALKLAEQLGLNVNQKRILVIINLLHDIGHVAFSHAAETFVLERFRKYHHGLKSAMFSMEDTKNQNRSVDRVLSSENSDVYSEVNSYIKTNKISDKLVEQINSCSINCDRIEGTGRSLYSLEREYVDPFQLIEIFEIKNHELHIKTSMLQLVYQFWNLHGDLYKKYIYTNEVLASEAMLTRALELTFSSGDELAFLNSSDDQVRELISKCPAAKPIIDNFHKGKYFLPLSQIHMDIVNNFELRVRKSRFNSNERRKIEKEIGILFNRNKNYVITHLSYKKHFYTYPSIISQLSLFDENKTISAGQLNKVLRKRNFSGEKFEIFLGELQ